MILQDTEVEKALVEPIVCRFPYNDPSASVIIQQGWEISLNAAFCVLNELCRPPISSDVGKGRLKELVDEWASGPDHPIKAPVLRAARSIVDHAPLQWQECVALMAHVADYDGQRAALCIIYFAYDWEDTEGAEALERMDTEIRERWDAKGV